MRDHTISTSSLFLRSLVASLTLLSIPSPRAEAQVVINEIMYRSIGGGGAENTLEEFIELHNTDLINAIDLTGWRFTKGVNYTFPAVQIPAGGYLVVAADIASFNSAYAGVTAPIVGGWTGQLSNSGERIRLLDVADMEVDDLDYSDQGDWAQRVQETLGGTAGWNWASQADDAGHSLELRNPSLSNKNGQNWSSSAAPGGTPGAINTTASTDVAPLLSKIAHSPAVPNFSQTVTISATLEDEEPSLLSVSARWRVSAQNPGAFNTSSMTDPDADGVYTATLSAQPEGTVIEFYVEATDGSNTSTWPAATDQGQTANAHYQVDSTPQEAGTALYRVVLTIADRTRWNNINRQSDAQMNVTFIVSEGGSDGVRYRSGLRVRGNSSRTFNPPPMRINIPRETPWNGDTKLNVNSRYSFLQYIGMHLFATANLPAPDAKRVAFRINGENEATNGDTMRGFYVHLEPISSEMIDDKFPDDNGGNLYKKRSADPDRDEKRWGIHFENDIVYDEPNWYITDDWSKLTNETANDWSDLQNFVETMDHPGGSSYLADVSAVADIDQWCRWFAVMTIINSFETNLSNGIDDDYSMYRGELDSRFVLLPHDLDTIFGLGDTNSNPTDSIFPMLTANIPRANEDCRIPQLIPFFDQQEIRVKYFGELKSLLENEFSKTSFDATIQNYIGDWATDNDRNTIITYMDVRRDYLLSQINTDLSASSALPVLGGFPRTTNASATLTGTFNITTTSLVRVNGTAVALDGSAGTWSINNIALLPGINRVIVQAFDDTGGLVSGEHIDVWYDDGDSQALSGTVDTDTTLTAAEGPYTISGELVVATSATLTIEAGTSIFFTEDAYLTVNGILRAEGSEFSRIRFDAIPNSPLAPDPVGNGGLPAGPPKWDGIQFRDTISDQNLLTHVDVENAQNEEGSVGVHHSEVVLDHMGFAGTHLRMVYADSSSVTVQNSDFPNMFAPGESPDGLGLDNISEHVKGIGPYPEGGHFIIRNNRFGTNAGHNDVVDVDSGRKPNPILQVLDNVFLGVGDEQLDLGGDVYVAGNLFMNVNKDDETSDRGYANSISTGDSGSDTTIVVARNVFWDVDHAINLKRGTATIFENNTVVNVHPDFDDRFGNPNVGSAINLYVDEPGATAGDGAYAANNIFWDAPRIFGNADLPVGTTTPLELNNNLMSSQLSETTIGNRPGTVLELGSDNRLGSPLFVDEENGDFTLYPGSPGKGAGLAGQDLGADIPNALSISGEPPTVTSETSATLTVGGPGMFSFQWRLFGIGPWSEELPIGNGFDPDNGTVRSAEINLSGLSDGFYNVEVRGRDYAGNLQTGTTFSKFWQVDSDSPGTVRINEILADNRGAFHSEGTRFPDAIELYNPGAAAVDIGGMTLTDDPSVPGMFTFPESTTIAAGEYLVLIAGPADGTPGIHTGFSISADGEGVFLYSSGGTLLDSIEFGLQIPDFSIGRTGQQANIWALTKPTLGAPNLAQPFADPGSLKINEWLAATECLFEEDFIEVFNPGDLPAPLRGLALTDAYPPAAPPTAIPPLSFIPAGGFTVFAATGDSTPGSPKELDFRLSATHEWIYLLDQNDQIIDAVHLQAEGSDVSRGRSPDGGDFFEYFPLPTPGTFNDATELTAITTTLIQLDSIWSYEQSNTDLGTSWRDSAFDSAGWPTGPGLLYQEDTLNGPAGTILTLNPPTTHYFRHTFNFTGNPSTDEIEFDIFADDGAVVYLNGTEVRRIRMPGGDITHTTFASDGQGDASSEGPFAIPAGVIQLGPNVLAASVHQDDGTSSDVVFGLELRATETATAGEATPYSRALDLLNGLRITEIMYHPAATEALEFIELQNIGSTPLELGGVRFTDGVDFVFPEMTLEVGAYVMVVADTAAFTAEYGPAIAIAGEFTGRLSNDGESIVLQLPSPFDAAIMRFEYNDSWYRDSDGAGYSLEVLDTFATRSAWKSPDNWRASAVIGGTPSQISQPVIVSPTIALSILGDPFSYQIAATNLPSFYTATGLPSGLAVDTSTGLISGNSLEFGTFEIGLSATNGGGTGEDTLFLSIASSGAFADYEWDAVPNPIPLNSSVSLGARAVDAQGRTVREYNASVALGAFIGADNGSSVLITEAWDRSPDYFEIQNVGPTPVNTAGWFVAVNQAFAFGGQSGVNAAAGTTWTLPASMNAGQVEYRTDDDNDNFFGGDIPWTQNNFGSIGRRGWVMLLDDQGTLIDFVAWGYSAGDLASINLNVRGFNITLGDSWSGNGVNWNSAGERALQRSGSEDTNGVGDWNWVALTRGSQNVGLATPFPGGLEAITTTPDTAQFQNGTWTGEVSVGVLATDALMLLDDGAGHQALSNRFDVTIPGQPSITSPLAVIGVVGQPFSYQATATNFPSSFGALGLPAGIIIDPATGLISGTPTAAGSSNILLSAANAGGEGSALLVILVQADTDGDGMPDDWETANSLNPSSGLDGPLDSDGDGLSNQAEFLAGTDPQDPGSNLKVVVFMNAGSADSFTLQWNSVPGKRYRISTSNDLVHWTEVPGGEILATETATELNIDSSGQEHEFYRAETGLSY